MQKFETVEEYAIALSAYANIATYMLENNLSIDDDDDVKDAFYDIVTITNAGNVTDEELDEALTMFRELQSVMTRA